MVDEAEEQEAAEDDDHMEDEVSMMQVAVDVEARMDQLTLQNEARRQERNFLAVDRIQQRGEGPEYRWDVQVFVESWDASSCRTSWRDVLLLWGASRTFQCFANHPMVPRELGSCPTCRSFATCCCGAFLNEECALQLQERTKGGWRANVRGEAGIPETEHRVASSAARRNIRRARRQTPSAAVSSWVAIAFT